MSEETETVPKRTTLTPRLVVSILVALALAIFASCGGGGGGSGGSSPPPTLNPVPSITSLSPSSVTAGAAAQTLTINGTNFLSSSTVTYNSAAHAATFVSSAQLTISLSASDQATAGSFAVAVTNPPPGGGPSNSANFLVSTAATTIGSLVMIATPAAGGPATGAWTVAVAAVDSTGKGISDLAVTLNTTAGTISPGQGLTDSTGTLMASVSPPASNSGQAVAVSASGGGRTAVVNIAFVSSSDSASSTVSSMSSRRKASESLESLSSEETTLATPFLYGTSAATAASNPFSDPNLCYSNAELSTTVTATCQSVYDQNAVQQSVPNIAKTVCSAVSLAAGVGSCLGTTAIVASCLAGGTGVGLAICAGTVQYVGVLGPECVGFLADELATHLTNNSAAASSIDVMTFDPTSANPVDIVGLICDVVTGIGSGTGSSGVEVTINPVNADILTGANFQFGATVSSSADTAVTWSVNGGVAGFGSISTSGLYTAPSALPSPDYPITVTATSMADQTARANAIVTIAAAPTLSSIAPNSAPVGSSSLTLSLSGSNFVADSVANFNGSPLATTFVDTNDLTAVLPAADLLNAGVFPVTVSDPDTAGAVSGAVDFTVTASAGNPVPTISSLSPSSLAVGATPQNLTINGTGFLSNSTVTYKGITHAPTFVTATQLTIALTSADLATAGSFPIVVTNPLPGGGASNAVNFTVASGSTGSVSISPTTVTVPEGGYQTFTATVSGGGSVNWSVQEGSAGGSITSGGGYAPPNSTGTFHVVATNTTDPSQSATATVTVVASFLSVLHSFTGTPDGIAGTPGLLLDAAGDLYGATEWGGLPTTERCSGWIQPARKRCSTASAGGQTGLNPMPVW